MKLKTLLCLSLITLVTSVGLAAYAQTYSVIHSFTGQLDGAEPYGGVILRGGSLYGTTNWGGYGLPGPGPCISDNAWQGPTGARPSFSAF